MVSVAVFPFRALFVTVYAAPPWLEKATVEPAPVAPVAPVGPVGPVSPVLPVGPVGPVGPVEPVPPKELT